MRWRIALAKLMCQFQLVYFLTSASEAFILVVFVVVILLSFIGVVVSSLPLQFILPTIIETKPMLSFFISLSHIAFSNFNSNTFKSNSSRVN